MSDDKKNTSNDKLDSFKEMRLEFKTKILCSALEAHLQQFLFNPGRTALEHWIKHTVPECVDIAEAVTKAMEKDLKNV